MDNATTITRDTSFDTGNVFIDVGAARRAKDNAAVLKEFGLELIGVAPAIRQIQERFKSQNVVIKQEQALEVLIIEGILRQSCIDIGKCSKFQLNHGGGLEIEVAGGFVVGAEGSVKFVIVNEGGPRWTFGYDIGIIRTEGVGGSTPDAAIEIGATSLKGSIQDGTRDTFEFNATLDFGTGLSVDVPFDTEAAAKEFQDLIENASVEQILNYLNLSDVSAYKTDLSLG